MCSSAATQSATTVGSGATGDIDFLYRTTPTNVARLCAALRAFGAPSALIDPAFLSIESSVTQLGVPPIRIDLLGSISGRSFTQVWRGAEQKALDGVTLRIISLPDLLLNKRATGRAKDRADVKALEQAAQQGQTSRSSRRRRAP